MEIEEIQSLVEMLVKHDIGELDATFGTIRMTIRRETRNASSHLLLQGSTVTRDVIASDATD